MDTRAVIESAVQKWNAHDESYFEAYRADAVWHGLPPGLPPTNDGAAMLYRQIWGGMSDARVTFEDTVAEGDKLAIRFTLTGTHDGELMGAQPTGNAVRVDALTILRFEDGEVVERWTQLDNVALMTQLGLMPEPAPAA